MHYCSVCNELMYDNEKETHQYDCKNLLLDKLLKKLELFDLYTIKNIFNYITNL
jgi:hypothetical protein